MKKILKFISVILIVALFFAFAAASGSGATEPTKVGTVGDTQNQNNAPKEEEIKLQEIYNVGDILSAKGMKIVYVSSGEYTEKNEFLKPKAGNKYIFADFYAENESNSDVFISEIDFACFADGYAVDSYYGGDDTISATLSKGRFTEGRVYFEVPKDSKEIEIEYEVNWLSDKKVKFSYTGKADSGFKPTPIKTRAENAIAVGDIVEYDDMRITFLKSETYKSSNQFIQPKKGYKYQSIILEFENIGKSDRTLSSFSFNCYADGASCDSSFVRDDDLSATISAGRKAKGSVTFEVPTNAEVIEIEYEPNIFLSNRIVFTAQ